MADNNTLADLLTIEQVSARYPAKDWQDAVEKAGELLIAAGCATEAYTQAMKDSVREYGPYIVITTGVAMPHARPESGVLAPGISVLTLQTPCNFGHEANDPVDVVIAFAAIDKNAHISTLQRIVTTLDNEAVMAKIRAADSDEALLQALALPTT